jgi:hypothetical protein
MEKLEDMYHDHLMIENREYQDYAHQAQQTVLEEEFYQYNNEEL